MRFAHKVDSNQAEIIDALEQCGAIVFNASRFGDQFPDLIVGYRGQILLMECKADGNDLSEGQEVFHARWKSRGLPVFTVRSPEDALRKIGVGK